MHTVPLIPVTVMGLESVEEVDEAHALVPGGSARDVVVRFDEFLPVFPLWPIGDRFSLDPPFFGWGLSGSWI
jgi:hypothetical protein